MEPGLRQQTVSFQDLQVFLCYRTWPAPQMRASVLTLRPLDFIILPQLLPFSGAHAPPAAEDCRAAHLTPQSLIRFRVRQPQTTIFSNSFTWAERGLHAETEASPSTFTKAAESIRECPPLHCCKIGFQRRARRRTQNQKLRT